MAIVQFHVVVGIFFVVVVKHRFMGTGAMLVFQVMLWQLSSKSTF